MILTEGDQLSLFPDDFPDAETLYPADVSKGVCLTGHRPNMIKQCELDDLRLDLTEALIEAIEEGFDTFYCGMAMGCDIIAGEAVAALREQYPWIKLIAVIPFPEQTDGWPENWKERYTHLLERTDEQTVLLDRYQKDGYLRRDRYMVDRSGMLIGIYNGSVRGGTAYTIRYAAKKGLRLRIIPPGKYRLNSSPD